MRGWRACLGRGEREKHPSLGQRPAIGPDAQKRKLNEPPFHRNLSGFGCGPDELSRRAPFQAGMRVVFVIIFDPVSYQ